jgi:hypothetical protein
VVKQPDSHDAAADNNDLCVRLNDSLPVLQNACCPHPFELSSGNLELVILTMKAKWCYEKVLDWWPPPQYT